MGANANVTRVCRRGGCPQEAFFPHPLGFCFDHGVSYVVWRARGDLLDADDELDAEHAGALDLIFRHLRPEPFAG